MKPRILSSLVPSSLALIAVTFSVLPALAQTTWDGGGGADTNVDTAANWNNDIAPSLTGTTGVIFTSANNIATLNVPAAFRLPNTTTPAVQFGANFTLNTESGNSLTLYGTNSGVQSVLRANSGASSVTINAPIEIFATSPAASPLGNLLVINVNNATAANTALNITGGISRASGSTAATYDLRFGNNVTAGVVAAKAKISSTISRMANLVNANPGGAQWSGDLIIAGDQPSLSTSNISISSGAGFGTPQTSARIVLGETDADDQTWNNITLNNVMNLAIGGNITANAFSGNTTNTRITGASATGNISFNSGTIGANVVLGGTDTNQNNLSIIKKSSCTLNLNSTTATYTGATTVEAGTLGISSATNHPSPITVKAGATLSGEGATTSSLTFDAGTSTLSFDPTTPGSLTTSSLGTSGATIIASPSGATALNTPYAVLTRSNGTFTASDVAAFLAAGRASIGGAGTNTITYTATAPASLTWKGNDVTNPSFWDLATTFNWTSGAPDRFFANDAVTFDDSANSFTVEIQGTSLSPGDMTFNHSANHYTVGGGTIGGTGSLTKNGSGTLTLTQAGTNAFSGALNINGGVLSISNLNQIGGTATTRPIQLGGGTLEYTNNTTNAQTSESIPLVLKPGDSTLAITGNYPTPNSVNAASAPVTLRLGAPITGEGNLTKNGPGILALGKNSATNLGNTFSGTLTVTGGILDVRNPDALGDTSGGTIISNAQLELFAFGQNAGVSFDPEPLTLSGNSYFRSKNEDPNSDIEHVWTGPVTISADAVVGIACIKQVSTSAVTPNTINSISTKISSLEFSGPVTTMPGSTLKFGLIQPSSTLPVVQSDVPQTVILSGALTGAASVETQGEATSLYTLAAPGYAGNTTVNGGILSLGAANSSNNASTVSIATAGATLLLDFEGTDSVEKLFIGGVQQAAGTYKAVGNEASGIGVPQLSGSGTLTVTSSPTSGYADWAAANAPGQTVDQDHDFDGVQNGIEYFMGLSGNAFTPNPAVTSGAVSWPMGASYAGIYGIDYEIQTSTNLSSWTLVPAADLTIIPGASVSYTLPTGADKVFVRLIVRN